MPPEPDNSKTPAPTAESSPVPSLPRFRIAFNVVVQIVLLLFIAVVANYLSCRHHKQWDLTLNRKFTLTTTTAQFLRALDQDVTVIVAYLNHSPLSPDVKALVDQYQLEGSPRISIEYVDPARNPARAADIKSAYNIALEQNVIIVATGDRIKVVAEEAMAATDKTGRVVEFNGENALTSALIEVTEKEKKKIYFASGHRNVPELQILFKEIHDLISKQNAELHEVLLSTVDSVPEDCQALLLLGPQIDCAAREIEMLRTWWEKEKGSLFILLDPSADTPNLNAFIRAYGVVPRMDRVLYAASVSGLDIQKVYDVPALFLSGPPIARDMVGLNTVFPILSQSLKIYETDAVLSDEGITLTPLVLADNRFWGETNFAAAEVTFDASDDIVPPIYLAASIEKRAVDDPRLRIKSSRMVVVGNSHILDSSPQRIGQNHDFFMSTINWMLDRDELIGISPKFLGDYNLSLSPKQKSRIQLIVLILMPAGAFLLAFTVWSARRH